MADLLRKLNTKRNECINKGVLSFRKEEIEEAYKKYD